MGHRLHRDAWQVLQLDGQLSKDPYANNRLVGKQFKVSGGRGDLGNIQQPILVVSAGQDNIVPPLAAKGLMDLVSSRDKEYVQLPGGHISVFSGRQANQRSGWKNWRKKTGRSCNN